MSIVLRTVKGSALTYEQLDENLSQFYYSASLHVSGTRLRLHYTGSAGLSITPGYDEVVFPTTVNTLQSITDVGSSTTNSITALSFIKSGSTSDDILLGDGTTTTFSEENNTIIVTNDAYTGDRIASKPAYNGFEVRSGNNEAIGYRAQNTGSGNAAYAGFVASNTASLYDSNVSMQIQGNNYFVPKLANKGMFFSTNDIANVTLNNSKFQHYISPDSTLANTVLIGEQTSNGTWFKVLETPDTGTTIDLGYTLGNLCNMASANPNSGSYQLTNIRTGGNATILINASSEPTVTGATFISGSANARFTSNKDLYLKVWNNGNRSEYYYIPI